MHGALVLAHPVRWDQMKVREEKFQEAERARLLYVAATRAKRELLVAQCETSQVKGPRADESTWRPLAAALEEFAVPLELAVTPAPGRRTVTRSAASIAAAAVEAEERRKEASTPSIRFVTVTEEAKGTDAEQSLDGERGGRGRGVAWGRAVHRSIEALGRGRSGDSLHSFVRAVAVAEELDGADAEDLVALIERTAASEGWRSLVAGGEPRLELTLMSRVERDGVETILEGVIDAAVLGDAGWRVVDWKSDVVDAAGWAAREARYAHQVDAYSLMLAALSGRPATGAVERLL
jgi:ATP-dependent helicase/nuclease subunit A